MKGKSFDLGTVGGLFIVCLFAVLMFMTLAFGSLIYSDITEVMEKENTVRTAAGYLATRARQGNSDGMLSIGEFDGCAAMIIREEMTPDEAYLTYIYCWDGFIRELYCQEGELLTAEDGDKVVEADTVSFRLDGGLLGIRCTAAGRDSQQYVKLSMREGG